MIDETSSDVLANALVSKPARVSDNTDQEVIIVTRDKVELALRRKLHKYVSPGQILSSLGLFLALLTTLVTAEFADRLGIKGDTWFGIFLAGTIFALVLLVRDLVRLLKRPNLDDLVDDIERDGRKASSPV